MFEVFFQLDRQKRFKEHYPDETMPTEWSMARRSDMLAGWLARASLHVVGGCETCSTPETKASPTPDAKITRLRDCWRCEVSLDFDEHPATCHFCGALDPCGNGPRADTEGKADGG